MELRDYIPLDERDRVSSKDLPTKAHVSRIIEDLNLYGAGIRAKLIEHIEAAEMRGYESSGFDED